MAAKRPGTMGTFALRKVDIEGTSLSLTTFPLGPVDLRALPQPLHISHDDPPRAREAELAHLRELRAANPTEYAERTRPLSLRAQAAIAEQRKGRLRVWSADESSVFDGETHATSGATAYVLLWQQRGGPQDELCVTPAGRWFTLRPRPAAPPPTAEDAEAQMKELHARRARAEMLLRGAQGARIAAAIQAEDVEVEKVTKGRSGGGRGGRSQRDSEGPEPRAGKEEDDVEDEGFGEATLDGLREEDLALIEEELKLAGDGEEAEAAEAEKRKNNSAKKRKKQRRGSDSAPDYDPTERFDDDKEGLEESDDEKREDEDDEEDGATSPGGTTKASAKRERSADGAEGVASEGAPDAKRPKVEEAPAPPPPPKRVLRVCEADIVMRLKEFGEIDIRRFIEEFAHLIKDAPQVKKQFIEILKRVSTQSQRAGNTYLSLKK